MTGAPVTGDPVTGDPVTPGAHGPAPGEGAGRRRGLGAARVTRAVALALCLAGLAAFVVQGANRPADPRIAPSSPLVPSSRLPGFPEVAFSITPAPGPAGTSAGGGLRARCGVLASTPAQRETGLMGRRDLAGYAGMVFSFASPTRTYFYMKDTPLPLSIAWWGAGGGFVGSADMAPCAPAAAACPLYRPAGPYVLALEVPQGRLASLGAGPGAHLALDGQCIP